MGKNWGIAVGINHYHNLKSLKYAQRDAEVFRDFCLNEADFEQICFFAEKADKIPADRGMFRAEPTLGNLEVFLRVRFEQEFLKPGDNLWFFFAGHGKREKGRDYLMPIDGDPGNVHRTGLAIHYIADRLRRSGADNVLLILDACRSEDDRDGGEGIGGEKQQGVITLFSCVPSKSAYEIDELEAGSFTHALIEGLRIQGEGNCATVERLGQHLRYRVPELNQRYNKPRQDPYLITEPATKLHLILFPKYATLKDVADLKNDAFEAAEENDLDLAERLWIRVLAASPGDLQAVKALQRIAVKKANQPVNSNPAPAPSNTADARTGEFASPVSPPSTAPEKPLLPFEVLLVDSRGQETRRYQKKAEYRREDLGQGATLDLMQVPSGEFMMGSPDTESQRYGDESPQHRVTVSSFWMGKYSVTQAQYQAVMGQNPSRFTDNGANRPVEKVSWNDAVAFCQQLSKQTGREYRLPSEAEWEYACRAGTTTPFHFGPTITPDLANYCGNYAYGNGPKGKYREETTAVGSFQVANDFGLYDMHGNVWEWCLDHFHDSYEGAPPDGSAWTAGGNDSFRMLRGGSWVDHPRNCRSANRDWYGPVNRYDVIGFRVVCSSAWALP